MRPRPEAGGAPHGHERVDLVPAEEAHTKSIVLEYAGYLAEGRFKPGRGIVIRNASSGTVAVSRCVRWVSQNEIDTGGWQCGHHLDAVAGDYAIQEIR
jgi:hypothetical protein